jgi:hypothetical protein
LKWQLFEQNIVTACASLQNPSSKKTILAGFFFFILLLLTIVGFAVYEASALVDIFFDYWN